MNATKTGTRQSRMINEIVVILNIFSISACVALAFTWFPLAKKTFTSRNSTMIGAIGVGLVLMAVTTGSVRQYSFMMRELDMLWLRDSYIAPMVIFAQSVGLVLLAASYYLPRESGRITASPSLTGVYAGAITFVLMTAIKVVF
jgi:hypothetical protein